jgi:cytochrome c-type biogenesis protein CcmE
MAQTTANPETLNTAPASGGRTKFLIGGLLIIGAIIYLVFTTMQNTAQYFYTVDEIRAKGDSLVGQNLRASGAVLGETIAYDAENLIVSFEMAHISADQAQLDDEGGLALALHNAVINPSANRVMVKYEGPMPDLLQNEAQAIVTGRLGQDGVFYADELLLKCPTRYEEALPTQAAGN